MPRDQVPQEDIGGDSPEAGLSRVASTQEHRIPLHGERRGMQLLH